MKSEKQIVISEVQEQMAVGQNTAGHDDGGLLINEDSNMRSDHPEETAGRDVNITTPQQPLERDREAGSSSLNKTTGSVEPVETESTRKIRLKLAQDNLKTLSERKKPSPESMEAGTEVSKKKITEFDYDSEGSEDSAEYDKQVAEIMKKIDILGKQTEPEISPQREPEISQTTLQRIANAARLPLMVKAAFGLVGNSSPSKKEIAETSAPAFTPHSNDSGGSTSSRFKTVFSRRKGVVTVDPSQNSPLDSAKGALNFSDNADRAIKTDATKLPSDETKLPQDDLTNESDSETNLSFEQQRSEPLPTPPKTPIFPVNEQDKASDLREELDNKAPSRSSVRGDSDQRKTPMSYDGDDTSECVTFIEKSPTTAPDPLLTAFMPLILPQNEQDKASDLIGELDNEVTSKSSVRGDSDQRKIPMSYDGGDDTSHDISAHDKSEEIIVPDPTAASDPVNTERMALHSVQEGKDLDKEDLDLPIMNPFDQTRNLTNTQDRTMPTDTDINHPLGSFAIREESEAEKSEVEDLGDKGRRFSLDSVASESSQAGEGLSEIREIKPNNNAVIQEPDLHLQIIKQQLKALEVAQGIQLQMMEKLNEIQAENQLLKNQVGSPSDKPNASFCPSCFTGMKEKIFGKASSAPSAPSL